MLATLTNSLRLAVTDQEAGSIKSAPRMKETLAPLCIDLAAQPPNEARLGNCCKQGDQYDLNDPPRMARTVPRK